MRQEDGGIRSCTCLHRHCGQRMFNKAGNKWWMDQVLHLPAQGLHLRDKDVRQACGMGIAAMPPRLLPLPACLPTAHPACPLAYPLACLAPSPAPFDSRLAFSMADPAPSPTHFPSPLAHPLAPRLPTHLPHLLISPSHNPLRLPSLPSVHPASPLAHPLAFPAPSPSHFESPLAYPIAYPAPSPIHCTFPSLAHLLTSPLHSGSLHSPCLP